MILAEGYWHGDEYIPEIVDDPWANLESVARVLGRKQIDVRAYVTKTGDLGLWLDTLRPLPIHEMLIGKVSRARTIKVAIPSNIQQPLVGVKSAIRVLRFSLAKGVESTGCSASKKWTLKFQNVYTDGSQTKTATAPCRR